MLEWHGYCHKAAGVTSEGDRLEVEFASGRRQRVTVEELPDRYVLRSIAARASEVPTDVSPDRRAWTTNRTTDLVGFRIDSQGRFIGEAWVPKLGLTAEEFVFVARRVAAECDRMEYVLTGEERE